LALADALDLWRVLAATLAALLLQHAPGQEQRPYECFPQIFIPMRAARRSIRSSEKNRGLQFEGILKVL